MKYSVNLNAADTICPFCNHLNFSLKTAKQLETQLMKYEWLDEKSQNIVVSIKCDCCDKFFEKSHTVVKLGSVLFLRKN